MDVSVICPVHGNGRYLESTLNSIKSQVFRGDFEVILVLDRCSEEVSSTINPFKDSLNIKILESKIPGLVAALNLGLQVATGKYVARIDSDDVMHSDRLEEQFSFLELNEQIIVLGSSVIEIDEYGTPIGQRTYPSDPKVMHKSLSRQCTIAHPSVMFRLSDVSNLGAYRPFFEHAEDYDLWMRVRDNGKLLSMVKPLTFYRIHAGQVSILQHQLRVFGSYSVRINNILERKKLRNLITRYDTFENWSNSIPGQTLFNYAALRILIARKIGNFESNKVQKSLFEKLFFGLILSRIKKLKRRREL